MSAALARLRAFLAAASGVALVEIRSHRHENRLQHGALVDAVRAALADALEHIRTKRTLALLDVVIRS